MDLQVNRCALAMRGISGRLPRRVDSRLDFLVLLCTAQEVRLRFINEDHDEK